MRRLAAPLVMLLVASAAGEAVGGEESRARGLVRSLGEAALSSELSARILAMPYREGQAFPAGAPLVTFDCERLNAEVVGLEADVTAARATHDGNRTLERHKAIGSRDLMVSGAKLERAEADLKAGRARQAGCVIAAPFDGVVVEATANPHEIANPSAPLMRIVDAGRTEIELIAPSRWLGWLAPGDDFTFTVDETGSTLRGRIVRLGGVVDPVSQTVKAFGVLVDRDPRVRPGMSGTATFVRAGG